MAQLEVRAPHPPQPGSAVPQPPEGKSAGHPSGMLSGMCRPAALTGVGPLAATRTWTRAPRATAQPGGPGHWCWAEPPGSDLHSCRCPAGVGAVCGLGTHRVAPCAPGCPVRLGREGLTGIVTHWLPSMEGMLVPGGQGWGGVRGLCRCRVSVQRGGWLPLSCPPVGKLGSPSEPGHVRVPGEVGHCPCR